MRKSILLLTLVALSVFLPNGLAAWDDMVPTDPIVDAAVVPLDPDHLAELFDAVMDIDSDTGAALILKFNLGEFGIVGWDGGDVPGLGVHDWDTIAVNINRNYPIAAQAAALLHEFEHLLFALPAGTDPSLRGDARVYKDPVNPTHLVADRDPCFVCIHNDMNKESFDQISEHVCSFTAAEIFLGTDALQAELGRLCDILDDLRKNAEGYVGHDGKSHSGSVAKCEELRQTDDPCPPGATPDFSGICEWCTMLDRR